MADTTISQLSLSKALTANNFIPVSDGTNTTRIGTESLFGFRNRIINGDMRIDQRNDGTLTTYGSGVNIGNFIGYPVDRWLAQSHSMGSTSGFVFTGQRNSSAPKDFKNSLQIAITTSKPVLQANDTSGVFQVIEGYNVSDLNWGTVNAKSITVSFWVKSSVTGSFGAHIRNGIPNRCYLFLYNITSPDTWEYKTVTIPGDTTDTWYNDTNSGISIGFCFGAGATYTGIANTWQNGNLYTPSGGTSLISIPGATWNITGVQIEDGSSATPFERRPYGLELSLCQRYFVNQKYNNATDEMVAWMYNISVAGYSRTTIFLPVEMRIKPTVIWRADNTSYGRGSIGTPPLTGTQFISTKTFTPYCNNATGGIIITSYTADAEFY